MIIPPRHAGNHVRGTTVVRENSCSGQDTSIFHRKLSVKQTPWIYCSCPVDCDHILMHTPLSQHYIKTLGNKRGCLSAHSVLLSCLTLTESAAWKDHQGLVNKRGPFHSHTQSWTNKSSLSSLNKYMQYVQADRVGSNKTHAAASYGLMLLVMYFFI